MSTDHDDLRSRLEELGGHLNAVRLPGPAAARRRARQRTRRQAGTAVLGAVAAAVGMLVVGQPGLWTEPQYAEEPTAPVPAPTGSSPAPPTDQSRVPALPESVLLTADDLERESDEPVGWTLADLPEEPFTCVPEASPAAPTLRRTHEVGDGRIDQVVEEYPDAEAAQVRFEEIGTEVLTCAKALREDGSVDSGGPPEAWSLAAVGDAAGLLRYWTPVTDGEWRELVQLSVVRTGTAVTTVAQGGLALDANLPMSYDFAVAAAERLCEPAGGACVGDPERQQTFPEPPAESAGWLHAADIEDVIRVRMAPSGVDGWDATPYFDPCIPLHALDVGATRLERQLYAEPDDPTSGVMVTQHVAVFPDGGLAEDYFRTVQASSARDPECEGQEAAATFSGDGFEGAVWQSPLAGTDTVASYGVVTRDRIVATVEHSVDPWEEREVTPQQWQALVARAGERLADLP